ncbi:MAG: hypothetical protein AMXMBFR61_09980 [Fimbriimonadales bacterium]
MNSAKAVQTMPSGITGPGDRVRWRVRLPNHRWEYQPPYHLWSDSVERGVVLTSDAKVPVPTLLGRLSREIE